MKDKYNILLAEDDVNLGNLLKEYLEIKGHDVSLKRDGEEAVAAQAAEAFDLLILDVMMPKKDGFTVAREVRKSNEQVPIIFLTAKGNKEDKILGFEAGADDYLTKPFSMEELMLRVKAIMKRSQPNTPANSSQRVFHISSFVFDYETQCLKREGNEVKLSTKEADLLRMLCLHQNAILLREEALKEIWGDDDYFTARSMDVYITKLRKYLKPDERIQIMNIHGKGYKLLVE
ncbi:MAG: response regulator transcription factor [Sphingobacteriales bacterium]|nr:MAG: response regulator transcription factor [Sphingobacteriales bacterium]